MQSSRHLLVVLVVATTPAAALRPLMQTMRQRAPSVAMQAATATSTMTVAQACKFFAANPSIDVAEKKAYLAEQGVSEFVISQSWCTATGMEWTVAGHPGEEGSDMSVAQGAKFFAANPLIDATYKKEFLVSKGVPKFVIAQSECTATGMEKTVAGHPGEGGGAGVDLLQLAKFPVATALEFGLIAAVLKVIDSLVTLPTFCVPPLFFFLSLRSRIFSFLPASRPNRGAQDGAATPKDVKRPSWTPPGIAFPFIWLTISCLRAASSTLIYASAGRSLVAPPLLALVLHLCVGDTWNCITNVERRLGTAAVGVFGVLASVYFAVAVYFKALPLAGYLLAPSAVWISIATVLTWAIWNINEPREPLLPQKGDGLGAPLRLPLSSVFEA